MSKIMRGQNVINILLVSLVFIIVFFVFIVIVFLPAGKTYKKEHKIYQKQMYELQLVQESYDTTMDQLKELQAKNRSIILGYENIYDTYLFHKQYDHFFKNLKISKVVPKGSQDIFNVYEVMAHATLTSPADFYEFLEEINKGDNIVHVQFPINFTASKGTVSAAFKMQIFSADYEKYLKLRDVNASMKKEGAKF